LWWEHPSQLKKLTWFWQVPSQLDKKAGRFLAFLTDYDGLVTTLSPFKNSVQFNATLTSTFIQQLDLTSIWRHSQLSPPLWFPHQRHYRTSSPVPFLHLFTEKISHLLTGHNCAPPHWWSCTSPHWPPFFPSVLALQRSTVIWNCLNRWCRRARWCQRFARGRQLRAVSSSPRIQFVQICCSSLSRLKDD